MEESGKSKEAPAASPAHYCSPLGGGNLSWAMTDFKPAPALTDDYLQPLTKSLGTLGMDMRNPNKLMTLMTCLDEGPLNYRACLVDDKA